MRKSFISGLVVGAVLLTTAAQAQTSVACMYLLLRVYHAEMQHCGVTLTKEREDRFLRMRGYFEKFIRENVKGNADAMIANIGESEKRAIAGLKSCQSDDFKLARQAMDQLTDLSNERLVIDTLKVPRNPQSGSCG